MSDEEEESGLRARFGQGAQGHVFAFWPSLSAQERTRLLETLGAVHVDHCVRLFNQAAVKKREKKSLKGPAHSLTHSPTRLKHTHPLTHSSQASKQASNKLY